MSPTREAIALAMRRGGFITTHEAEALGLSSSALRRKVLNGVFVRVRPGVYMLPGAATRPDVELRIACHILSAVVSHHSAAAIHGFESIRKSEATVTVSHRSTHRLPGVVVHQSTDLLDAHVVEIDGLPVTTPVRTVIDLAKVLDSSRLETVMENALASSKVDFDELYDLFSAIARRGKPGVRKLRRLLEEKAGGSFVSESELERRFRKLIEDAGLPRPQSQFGAKWLKQSNGRVDFAYPEKRIVIECDGRRWHSQFDAFEADRRRDNAAQLSGWRILRFTWSMLKEEPTRMVATIRQALEA